MMPEPTGLEVCRLLREPPIRDDRNYWNQGESYIARYSSVQVSHGICPECFDQVMKEEVDGRS